MGAIRGLPFHGGRAAERASRSLKALRPRLSPLPNPPVETSFLGLLLRSGPLAPPLYYGDDCGLVGRRTSMFSLRPASAPHFFSTEQP